MFVGAGGGAVLRAPGSVAGGRAVFAQRAGRAQRAIVPLGFGPVRPAGGAARGDRNAVLAEPVAERDRGPDGADARCGGGTAAPGAGRPAPTPAGGAMSEDGPLTEVITAYLQALDAGERPDRAEILARHPELTDEL